MNRYYKDIIMGVTSSLIGLSIIFWCMYGYTILGLNDIEKSQYIYLDWISTDLLIIGSIIFGIYLGISEIRRQIYVKK